MKNQKRKQEFNAGKLIVILIVVVIVLLAVFFGLRYLKQKITDRVSAVTDASAESAQVTVGSINVTVYGDGTLANEDSETLTLPSTVEVTEIFVEEGDDIEEGDLIASVNASTVLQAMAEKQAEIDDVDAELAEISEDSPDEEILAGVTGRVKMICVAEGDDVTDVMVRDGALMLLSPDGHMAVELKGTDLARGQAVTVTDAEGNAWEGSVFTAAADTAVILITDDGPLAGASVTVTDENGSTVGTGTLYVHEAIAVTGFTGTVSDIKVEENEKVDAGDTLMTLENVAKSANYATLLSEREELEEELTDLLVVYREGGVYAHSAGTITEIDEGTYASAKSNASASAYMMGSMSFGTASSSADSDSEGEDTTVSYCPSDTMVVTISVDESDILSLTVGQEASVYISSLSEDPFTAEVTEVGTSGTSSNGVTTYSVTLRVEKAEGMLSGMTASAYITIEGSDSALLIPADALHETASSAYVYTEYDEETDTLSGMVEVEVGLTNSQYAEITSGLSEGDTVYYKDSSEEGGFSFGSFSGMGGMSGMGGGGSDSFGGMGGGSQSIPGGMGGNSMPTPGGSGK